jgi:hypothetical protein
MTGRVDLYGAYARRARQAHRDELLPVEGEPRFDELRPRLSRIAHLAEK